MAITCKKKKMILNDRKQLEKHSEKVEYVILLYPYSFFFKFFLTRSEIL